MYYVAVMDDEDTERITAKSVVTLSVKLIRNSLQDMYNILGVKDDTPTSSKPEQQVSCLSYASWEGGVRGGRVEVWWYGGW